MKSITSAVIGVVALGTSAFAQGKAVVTPPVKPAGGDVVLSCAAGTKQVGGPKSALEASACVRTGQDGSRVFHGPYVAFWPNGTHQAEGQFDNGLRTGAWTFFDDKGVKTGETSFRGDHYDGLRVEFHANGQKKLEETYVLGKRQGAQLTFDLTGKQVSKVDFVDDRPVAAK